MKQGLKLIKFFKKFIQRVYQSLIKFLELMNQILVKFYKDVLNERSPRLFVKDIIINLLFILSCVFSTVIINYIPRPDHIYYKFLYRFDTYFFDVWKQPIGSLTGLGLTIIGSVIIYSSYYKSETHNEIETVLPHYKLKPLQISSFLDYKDKPITSPSTTISMASTIPSPVESSSFSPISGGSNLSEEDILDIKRQLPQHQIPSIKEFWNLIPVILLFFSWFLLNILYSIKYPINKPKNIIAWIFHVPVHFLVPPMIGSWLYLFHPPGSLRVYTFTLGLLNFALIITYLIFPNVPPTYIKIYGDNKIPTFDMIFTDGAAIEDKKFSFILHKGLYYASPYKFASFPSLHSSFACLIYFFVCHYSNWSSFKILGLINVLGQWWSDVYLDHHWRIDSLAGLIYALITWTILRNYTKKLNEIDVKFSKARLHGDFINGSTMGMRLFKNTPFQELFNPK